MTPWEIKGRELVNCTCEYGCNCQFNALPDKGHCHAVAGIQIDEGHYGNIKLDGLRIAAGTDIQAQTRVFQISDSSAAAASARDLGVLCIGVLRVRVPGILRGAAESVG